MWLFSVNFASGTDLPDEHKAHDYLLQQGVEIDLHPEDVSAQLVFALPHPSRHQAPPNTVLISQSMEDMLAASQQTISGKVMLVLIAPDHQALRDAWRICKEAHKQHHKLALVLILASRELWFFGPRIRHRVTTASRSQRIWAHRAGAFRPYVLGL